MVQATLGYIVRVASKTRNKQKNDSPRSKEHVCCPDVIFQYYSVIKGMSSLEKWLILALGQDIYQMSVENPTNLESKELLNNA
jgi:hypothetical protein